MRKIMSLIIAGAALLSLAPAARSQIIPSAHEVEIAWGAGTNLWAVPNLENGALLSIQPAAITNGATVAVSHLIPYGTGSYVTNSVIGAATNGVSYAFNPAYVAAPVWLVPGDYLLFTLSATNTAADIILRTGVR